MKTFTGFLAAALWIAILASAQSSPAQTYTVTLKPVSFPSSVTVPALHSFARAVGSGGQWLIVTGRTNGLHTFPTSPTGAPPPNAFPPPQANKFLWVIDPVAQKVWSAPVPAPPLGDSLTATNTESYQDGDTLYVFGGYGNQTSSSQMTTFRTITVIPVSATINAIMAGKALPAFQQISNWYDCTNAPNLTPPSTEQACNTAILSGNAQAASIYLSSLTGPFYAGVAGGGMEKAGGLFWMVFGQIFQGLYSANPGNMGTYPTKQQYTQSVSALWIGTIGGQLSAAVMNSVLANPVNTGSPPTAQWNRRDLNVVPAIDGSGNPMISVYGGVFQPGLIAPFQQPIHFTGVNNAQTIASTLDPYLQLFNLYDCASMKLYSAAAGTNQLVLFGGIGMYYISNVNGTLQKDTGLPFVNTMSVIVSKNTGVTGEFYNTTPLPGFIGANATFIPAPAVARQSGEIIALDKITTNTLAGWLYGGIISPQTQPPQGGSQASNAIYEVWLNPTTPPSGYWKPASANQVSVQQSQ
jgi:hypothetical protein